jgi:hypothetical protein
LQKLLSTTWVDVQASSRIGSNIDLEQQQFIDSDEQHMWSREPAIAEVDLESRGGDQLRTVPNFISNLK